MNARMAIIGDDGSLDDGHRKYEGGDGSLTKDTPWPGAANLGSYLVTESVDAMRARIMATIFTDPIWIVEGYGEAASRAPIVEEFHQWKADETKLQQYMGRVVHNSLIEGTGVLEVADRVSTRQTLRRQRVALQTDPSNGQTVLGDDGNPIPVRTATGTFQDAGPHDPHLEMVVRDVVRATAGPQYRVLNLKHFYILPGHASELSEIWGYAKRIYVRLTDLQRREKDGYYKNIDDLGGGSSSERLLGTAGVGDTATLARQGQDIAPQQDERTAEKELWELTLLLDLDDDGLDEWYVVTYSAIHRVLLRVQYEDYDTPHYVLATPFPRPNSIWGYSYAKDKLGTLYDEHTALRNMFMDRSILKTNAPLKVLETALYNPALHPWGPGQRLPVRQMDEVQQLEVADVPNSVVEMMKEVLSAKERLSGMNDITTGQQAQADRTLGENQLATQQSWIRIDEVVKNLQQAFEDLFSLLNTIWKAKLSQAPEPWPGDLLLQAQQLERPLNLGPTITADLLDGAFRGKPRGSVESSDFSQMRADFVQLMTALTQLGRAHHVAGTPAAIYITPTRKEGS